MEETGICVVMKDKVVISYLTEDGVKEGGRIIDR